MEKTAALEAYARFLKMAQQPAQEEGGVGPGTIGAGIGALGLGGLGAYSMGKGIGDLRKAKLQAIQEARKAGLHRGAASSAVSKSMSKFKPYADAMGDPQRMNMLKTMMRNPRKTMVGGGVGGLLGGAAIGGGLGWLGGKLFG
jgi:hypothetical protein